MFYFKDMSLSFILKKHYSNCSKKFLVILFKPKSTKIHSCAMDFYGEKNFQELKMFSNYF